MSRILYSHRVMLGSHVQPLIRVTLEKRARDRERVTDLHAHSHTRTDTSRQTHRDTDTGIDTDTRIVTDISLSEAILWHAADSTPHRSHLRSSRTRCHVQHDNALSPSNPVDEPPRSHFKTHAWPGTPLASRRGLRRRGRARAVPSWHCAPPTL
jgi:hypothetical protein